LFGGIVGRRLGAADELDDFHDCHLAPPRACGSWMSCLAPTPSSSAARCHGPTASVGASAGPAANSDSKRAIAAAIAAATAPVAVFSATGSLYDSAPGQVPPHRVDH